MMDQALAFSNSYEEPTRWLSVVNNDTEPCPPYGLLAISGVDANGNLTVARPSFNSQPNLLINGPFTIPPGFAGQAHMTWPGIVAYTPKASDNTAPAAGSVWGALANSWYLSYGCSGLYVLGGSDTTTQRTNVMPTWRAGSAGGSANWADTWGATVAITGTVDNLALLSGFPVVPLNPSSTPILQGIVAPTVAANTPLWLVNIGSVALSIQHLASATAANKIFTLTQNTVTLPANGWAMATYDTANSYWRIILASPPTDTTALTVTTPALTTTNVPGITLTNPTAATVGVQQQNSPGLIFLGGGWDTGLAANNPLGVQVQLLPKAGNPALPRLGFLDQENNGGWQGPNIVFQFGTNPQIELDSSSIGTGQLDGMILKNPTAAGAGAQQYSPMLRQTAQGWKTNATAASQEVDFASQARPIQGAANPTGALDWLFQVAAGGWSTLMSLLSTGALNIHQASVTPGTPASGVSFYADSSTGHAHLVDQNGTNVDLSSLGGGASDTLTAISSTATVASPGVTVINITNNNGLHGTVGLYNVGGTFGLTYTPTYTDMAGNTNSGPPTTLGANAQISIQLEPPNIIGSGSTASASPMKTFSLVVKDQVNGSHTNYKAWCSAVG